MKKNITENTSVVTEEEITYLEELGGNGEYKSDLFSLLMQEKEYALDTYNAVNDSDYDNPEEIQVITLEHGVSLSVRNDASFILDMSVNYYEHQSSYNPNMSLRNLLYCAEDIKRSIEKKKRNLYGSTRISIPTPHFMVFYNGTANRPEVEYQKLSESFYKQTDEPELELICKVININPGKNPEIMRKATVLTGYTTLVERVRENQKLGMTLRSAIHKAIDDCIKDEILDEFLIKKRYEVEKTMNLDFTFKRQLELTAEEQYAAGMEAGIQQEKARADAAEDRADAAEDRADAEKDRADAAEAEVKRLKELLAKMK